MQYSDRYWRMQAPRYASEGRAILVNGRVKHPFRVPGIDCPTCTSWGGSRILTVECPLHLQKLTPLRSVWPIKPYRHYLLRRSLEAELQAEGHRIALRPGDHFQPAEVWFAAHPTCDFFWPCGTYTIVSARTRDILHGRGVCGVEFCPAVVRCIGQAHPSSSGSLPQTGTLDELFEVIEKENDLERFGTFYEMVVTAEGHRPQNIKVSRCPICGYERIRYRDKKRRLQLTEDVLPDADIFYLADTLYLVVTDEVKQAIADSELSNVEFTEMRGG